MNYRHAHATVVAVDDDPDLRAALEALVTTDHYRYRGFASAETFLADTIPVRPCCLLLDVDLPGMSGLDLQNVLEQRPNPPPIVFISGCDDAGVEYSARQRGAVDFLKKPFDPQHLLDRIECAIQISATDRRG